MKKHRIFNVNEYVYGLFSSRTIPDSVIPIRGVIKDVKWDPVNPQYLVHILNFFDNYRYLKQNFFNIQYKKDFDSISRPMKLKASDFKNRKELEERLNQEDKKRFYVILDSVMCTKTKIELQELFNDVQFYLISKNLKKIRDFSARQFYTGDFKVDSVNDFDKRFIKGWGSNFKDLDIKDYLKTLD